MDHTKRAELIAKYKDGYRAVAAALEGANRPIANSLLAFQAARLSTGDLLDAMTDAEFEKKVTHPEHGRYGVDRWLEIYADHAHNHADQIRRARASAT